MGPSHANAAAASSSASNVGGGTSPPKNRKKYELGGMMNPCLLYTSDAADE